MPGAGVRGFAIKPHYWDFTDRDSIYYRCHPSKPRRARCNHIASNFEKCQRCHYHPALQLHELPKWKTQMLYDLENDPDENQNIVDQPEQKETVTKMTSLLKQRMQEAQQYKKPSGKK
jgi:hypothetical protein